MAGIDAYSIGVKLILDNGIISSLGSVDDKLGVVGLTNSAAGAARNMAAAWGQAASAAERMARAASSVGGVSGGGGGGSGGWYPSPASDPSPRLPGPASYPLLPGPGGGGGYVPPGGGGSGADEPFNPPGRPTLYPNGQPSGGGGSFSAAHAAGYVLLGAAVVDAAKGAATALTAPSFGIQDQLANIANMTPKGANPNTAMSQALATAIKIQQNPDNPGISIGQALAMVANVYSVDRNMSAVAAIAPRIATDSYILSHAQGGADVNGEMYSIIRAAEDLGDFNSFNKNGTINPAKAMSLIDLYTRLIANSNGNLTGAQALTLIGAAGPAATQLNNTALARAIIASQALGASQVGTGINALNQELIGGKMSQGTARALHDAGVLPTMAPDPNGSGRMIPMFGPDDKITKPFRFGIGMAMIPPGVLKDENLAMVDPVGWSAKDLFGKYLNPNGTVKTGDKAKVLELIADLNRDFSRIPGMKLAGNDVFAGAVQARQMENAFDMMGLPTLAATDASTASSQAAGAGAAYNAAIAALGTPLIPELTKGLANLSAALNAVSDASRAHPNITRDIENLGINAAALAAGWAGWKVLAGTVKWLGRFGAGGGATDLGIEGVATGAAAASGPPGWLIGAISAAVVAGVEALEADRNAGGNPREVRGRFGMVTITGQPAGTNADPIIVSVKNGIPLVSPSPTMPTGPTPVNNSKIPPRPGQVNRLSGH